MSPPLADHDPFDIVAAQGAFLAIALIHPEVILEIPAAVSPVDAGAVPPNTFC